MTRTQRRTARLFRQTIRLDRAWKAQGCREGRTENDLAWFLGRSARAGISNGKIDRARVAANGPVVR